MKRENKKDLIIKILKENPDGLTIQDVARLGRMSRITAMVYLHELLGAGRIVEKRVGAYRIFFLKEKYVELVKNKEVIEKIRKGLS
jgi:predicted transcriptional regulator